MPSSKVFTGTGRSQEDFERIVTSRIIAIVRLSDEASLVQVAEALARGGVECLEFTSGTPGFLDAIAESRRVIGERALIGAGTVVSEDQARECVAAGAQFVVSPGLFQPVVDAALDLDVVSIPGAMTPTEIIQAWEWGAHAVKVFPVRQLGPQYIRDVRGPVPHIPLVAVGGVDASNAAEYLQAGAIAVGVGGRLVDKDLVRNRDWPGLQQQAQLLVDAVSATGA